MLLERSNRNYKEFLRSAARPLASARMQWYRSLWILRKAKGLLHNGRKRERKNRRSARIGERANIYGEP